MSGRGINIQLLSGEDLITSGGGGGVISICTIAVRKWYGGLYGNSMLLAR